MPAPTDPDIEARRAAVQLRNALPQPNYVIEPPKRRLHRELDRQRHAGPNYEARIKAEQRREGRFRQPLPQKHDERNPPSHIHDDIPDGPGVHRPNGARLDDTDRGGVPAFLDRRQPNRPEPTFVDLVGGERCA